MIFPLRVGDVSAYHVYRDNWSVEILHESEILMFQREQQRSMKCCEGRFMDIIAPDSLRVVSPRDTHITLDTGILFDSRSMIIFNLLP